MYLFNLYWHEICAFKYFSVGIFEWLPIPKYHLNIHLIRQMFIYADHIVYCHRLFFTSLQLSIIDFLLLLSLSKNLSVLFLWMCHWDFGTQLTLMIQYTKSLFHFPQSQRSQSNNATLFYCAVHYSRPPDQTKTKKRGHFSLVLVLCCSQCFQNCWAN